MADQGRLLLKNPSKILRELRRVDSEERLVNFIEHHWHILEPESRPFDKGYHIEAMAEHLEAVTDEKIKRLLINVPPGFMKSLMCNVFWPAWEWGPKNKPSTRYVCASYSSSLTIRDNRKTRMLICHPRYTENWGTRFRLVDDQNAKVKFENDRTGWKLATSVEGVGTGERGDRVGVDDPHNVKESESDVVRDETIRWFTEVLPSRLNDPRSSSIMVIMQRVHERDVSGHILAQELGYEHLMLPMEYEPKRCSYTKIAPPKKPEEPAPELVEGRYIADKQMWLIGDDESKWNLEEDEVNDILEKVDRLPIQQVYRQDPRTTDGELLFPERYPREVVDRDKHVMGAYAVAGQYQQRPTPRGGAFFDRSWFTYVDRAPEGGVVCRGWDLAGSEAVNAARTSGVKIKRHKGVLYIMHGVLIRGSPGKVEELMKATAIADDGDQLTRQSVPQDPGQAGLAQKVNLAAILAGHDVRFSLESGDKIVRATPFSAQAEAGNVRIVRGPWNNVFLDEICMFPRGQYKDQVDAASRAANEVMRMSRLDDHGPMGAPIQVATGSREAA